jgi:hypothetical protein
LASVTVYNKIRYPFVARYVRILPVEWGSHACLRLALFGCGHGMTTTPTPTPTTTPTTPKCDEFQCANGNPILLIVRLMYTSTLLKFYILCTKNRKH